MGGFMLLVPGEFGEQPARPLVVYEACGIRWDDNDRLRFLSKCKWETMEVDGKLRRCLIWRGAKSRGGKRKTAARQGQQAVVRLISGSRARRYAPISSPPSPCTA
jgi:hypothetical protein